MTGLRATVSLTCPTVDGETGHGFTPAFSGIFRLLMMETGTCGAANGGAFGGGGDGTSVTLHEAGTGALFELRALL